MAALIPPGRCLPCFDQSKGGEKLERRPLPPALGLPATYLAYNARFQAYLALFVYVLFA